MHRPIDLEALIRPRATDCLSEFDPDSASSQQRLEQILSLPAEPRSRRPTLGRAVDRLGFNGLRHASLARLRARPRLLLPMLLPLVAAAAAAAAVSISGGRSAPVTLPGGKSVLCPVDNPYLADRSQGLEYPPDYPGPLPTGTRGLGCYATEQDAINAGFRPAPPPAGDTRLGALYLTPPSLPVREACRAASHVMRATVYCPTLLPAHLGNPVSELGPLASSWRNGIGADCPSRGCSVPLLSIWGGFPPPDTWYAPIQFAALAIWEMTDAQQRNHPFLTGCPDAKLLERTTFDGSHAGWYACNSFAGYSTGLIWHRGHEVLGISSTGPPVQRRQLIRYIANHLQQQTPSH